MKVLVLGAGGFVGSHVGATLRAAGHEVVGAGRRQPTDYAGAWHTLDFPAMVETAAWLPHLAGIDAVVNCVGIIREARAGDFDLLHRAVPVALFAACAQLGIHHVVQVSALGSHPDAATPYWRSKGAAEADLRRRGFGSIVRPSLVYGPNGASSRVFRVLATLPFLMMPTANTARVQPIHVDDLAAAVLHLLVADQPPREIAVVGPRAMTMAEYLHELRVGLQAPCGCVLDLPMSLARIAAHVGALIPSSALTPDALTMLVKSRDGSNTADAAPVSKLLGRSLRDPAGFASPELRAAAVMAWAGPLLRLTLALLWLFTAWVSWFGFPHAQSLEWLAACGVPDAWLEHALLASCILDAAIGLAMLCCGRTWIWPLQIAVVTTYTAILSICLPQFWLHPFGVLSKNLPLLALMFAMWRLLAAPR